MKIEFVNKRIQELIVKRRNAEIDEQNYINNELSALYEVKFLLMKSKRRRCA